METIKIKSNILPDLGYIIINKADFNPEIHEEFVEAQAAAPKRTTGKAEEPPPTK